MLKKIKKTVIIVDYRCNNACQFCNESQKRKSGFFRKTLEIKQEMMKARKSGTTYLELIGGELSIRSDLEELIKFAKSLGFSTILMATNGRMYSYFDFAKKIVRAGLTDIVFSIHGHNSKLHDSLTRAPGSFDQLIRGIDNFKKLGFKRIGSNTTIVRQNYRQLSRIAELILEKGIQSSEFIFVDPNEGGAYQNFDKLVPYISKAAPYLRKCLDTANESCNWSVRYVPLCYFKDYLDQVSEIKEARYFQAEHLAPDFEDRDAVLSRQTIGRLKTKRCEKCKLFDLCEGLWKEYFEKRGDKELKPIYE